MPARAMWTCPACGRRFSVPRTWHSCGTYSVDAFLAGRSEPAVLLYREAERTVLGLGPDVFLAPAKTRVGFQARMIFVAVNALGREHLRGHIVLPRRVRHRRLYKVEEVSPACWVHHFRLRAVGEIDRELVGWLRESYEMGR